MIDDTQSHVLSAELQRGLPTKNIAIVEKKHSYKPLIEY